MRVKCHSVLAFEQNNRIVNALCAVAHASKTIVKEESFFAVKVCSFFSLKKGHLFLKTESLLKTLLFWF